MNTPDILSFVSLIIAVIAAVYAGKARESARSLADRRSRAALYLALKERFSLTYKELAEIFDTQDVPDDGELRLRIFGYWHIAFDEWYATTKYGVGVEEKLWDEYFADQVVNALRYKILRKAFLIITENSKSLGAPYKDFRNEIDKQFRDSHKAEKPCMGIKDCEHHWDDEDDKAWCSDNK